MATIDALRDLLWERDGGACGICHRSVERSAMHIDHIVSKLAGGLDRVENLQPAHMTCNIRKGAGAALAIGEYSVIDVAHYLQVNVDTVRRWCRVGILGTTTRDH